MVGAGALITKECIPHSLMIGVPAYQKVAKLFEKY